MASIVFCQTSFEIGSDSNVVLTSAIIASDDVNSSHVNSFRPAFAKASAGSP